ncbi:MAG: hypothetical protein DRP47_00145 [Candidatus Zixiibacteriota bacterium]|nr:MAG: hypothetical protein DRP47_00145 [candidate division Zixibacteria bacterium]
MSEEILIPAIIFSAIVATIKIITDTNTRNKLIEKGMVDEKVKSLFTRQAYLQRLSSLKWGMVLVSIGLSLLISYIWPNLFTDGGTIGLMFLFAGIAFLIYYSIAQKQLEPDNELKE